MLGSILLQGVAAIVFTVEITKLSFGDVSGLVKVTGGVGMRSLSWRIRYLDTWFPVGDAVLKSYGGWLEGVHTSRSWLRDVVLSASRSSQHGCLLSCLPAVMDSSPSRTLTLDKLSLL